MAVLRCTKKLFNELKLKPEDPPEPRNELSGWHANLIRIDRRKCVLFTHDKTLFSFVVPGLKKPEFQQIAEIFRQNLFKNLLREELFQNEIELFLDDVRNIYFAKTNNRSVLGSMNDLTFQLRYMIADSGGLLTTDFMRLNYDLNRIPMRRIEQIHSIRELKLLCDKLNR